MYLRSILAFSVVSILALYALLRLQAYLPYSLGRDGHAVPPGLQHRGQLRHQHELAVVLRRGDAWATPSQMAGLAVQNFLSAAVGIAVAVALIRGLARTHTDRLGNFWVDLTADHRPHPAAARLRRAVVLVAGGVVQNLAGDTDDHHRSPAATQTIPGGPVASQEAIKELGTNGGGFYNANSAHPFENPNGADQPARDLPAPGHPVLA